MCKYTIKNIKDIIEPYGGKILGNFNDYDSISVKKYIKVQCAVGHIFNKNVGKVIYEKSWCKKCSSGLYERIVREYFEQLFGEKFEKIRPKWLRNNNGNLLELDGYCSKLNMAFEHNGIQHYEQTNKIKHNLDYIKNNDLQKKQICEKLGVKLIIIPELSKLKVKNLKEYIRQECIKQEIEIPTNYENIIIDISKAYSYSDINKLNIIKEIAKNNNFSCKSDYYIGNTLNLEFSCNKCDTKWKATPANIKKGTGCPKCGIIKNTIKRTFSQEYVKCFIENKGGKLLNEYKHSRCHIKIECCKCGNVWNCSFDNVKRGYWCAKCAKNLKPTIDEIKELFANYNIECLSDIYCNAHVDMNWKCKTCNSIFVESTNHLKNKIRKNYKLCIKCSKDKNK